MTGRIIEETVATSQDITPNTDENVATGDQSQRPSVFERPGLMIAGFVLSAALTTAGAIGTVPIAGFYERKRHEGVAESSTIALECDAELLDEIRELFERGASEFFQDGMHSAFSRTLLAILAQRGRMAVQAIAEYLFSGITNPDVVSEALRWLADFNDPSTLSQRWAVLQRTLQDRSPRVRDGAILGFAALDDPRARPLLLEARKGEQIPELRRLIDKVVEQLNATHAPAPPQRSRESLV